MAVPRPTPEGNAMARNKFGYPGQREADRAESAARVLKDLAMIRREPKLLKAARAFLKQEIKDSQKVLKTT